jgi:hypothetical protein
MFSLDIYMEKGLLFVQVNDNFGGKVREERRIDVNVLALAELVIVHDTNEVLLFVTVQIVLIDVGLRVVIRV